MGTVPGLPFIVFYFSLPPLKDRQLAATTKGHFEGLSIQVASIWLMTALYFIAFLLEQVDSFGPKGLEEFQAFPPGI